jgi:predicted dithiol-disulfide oxidoreductase (DUF899 family)
MTTTTPTNITNTTSTTTTATLPATHPVLPREQWTTRRQALLARERELTRLGDEVARERRALPWVRVDKPYVFDTPTGPRTLAELFGPHRQLLVQHFMLGPGWEAGCPSCSFMTDHLGGALPHLAQRDVAVALVSRAPIDQIERFRQRMGWALTWVSSHRNGFNLDFQVSFTPEELASGEVFYNYAKRPFPKTEAPGISVFFKDDAGAVFHTYSTYGRGVEAMMGTYDLLDLTPKGRDEDQLPFTMAWIRHHDRYEAPVASPAGAAAGSSCCHAQAAGASA